MTFVLALPLALALLLGAGTAGGQDIPALAVPRTEAPATQDAPINTRSAATENREIAERIRSIFSEIEGLANVTVRVSSGVVTLAGSVPGIDDAERAEAIAARVAGVVTVQNRIVRDLDVNTNVTTVVGQASALVRNVIQALPLLAVALLAGLLVGWLGYLLSSAAWLWRRLMPNPFLAEIAASLVWFLAVVLGLVTTLQVVGATALLGGVLGGAGVVGIAIGFAVRDTVDNYVSSLMLSLRQPFRANDHVVIEGHEGRVVRLTSRATVLMTLDGNHLRIPNSIVFKAVILNYTRNPERQFSFDLGVDTADDPIAAMATGLAAVEALPFVLDVPTATVVIREVGDSSVVLRFRAWVDQTATDFLKGRSLAIHAAADALTRAGFVLPEPIYRLRFDQDRALPAMPPRDAEAAPAIVPRTQPTPPTRPVPAVPTGTLGNDTSPETHVEMLVAEERAEGGSKDLLDSTRPIE